jgi:DNA-binding XRE family transcriptional regulator
MNMARTKKQVDKEQLRQRRTELYDAIAKGELTLQHAVKEMRNISRLTQAEFASHRGVSTKTIKDIESGKGNPTVETLNRIGQFFGLEVAYVRSENLGKQKMPALTAEASPARAAMHPPAEDAYNIMLRLENLEKLIGKK